MTLADHVSVARRFQRAIRVDTDYNAPRSLDGFICPESSIDVLLTMARHVGDTQQGSFTWTGPYGSGKSSLAVALCGLLHANQRIRTQAADAIGKAAAKAFWSAIKPGSRGWSIVPAMGQRASLANVIGDAMAARGLARRPQNGAWTDDAVVSVLEKQLASGCSGHGGILLLVDELGKCLEGAAQENHDIYLLQRIAEISGRSEGRLLFVGILHQAFDEYAQRVARDLRDEWSKIQGRFLDLIVNTGGDEQLELLSRAITADRRPTSHRALAKEIANEVRKGRAGASGSLDDTLYKTWPLHPVVSCLLGPLSRRRFGQNQRSLFGFLNSAEPLGFQEFLRHSDDRSTYDPARLWDYLRTNLEPSILASPDGHRWAMAVEATERCAAMGASPFHLEILKTVALLDLFKERSGLSATPEILATVAGGAGRRKCDEALKDLQGWSFLIFRKHLSAFAIHSGSDFDIDQALRSAMEGNREIDFKQLRSMAGLQPVLAKRHYHRTGALRWFDVDFVSSESLGHHEGLSRRSAIGSFLLVVPAAGENKGKLSERCATAAEASAGNTVIGLSSSSWQVTQLAREFVAIRKISEDSPELSGDAVARREVMARLSDVRSRLEADLQRMFKDAMWYRKGQQAKRFNLSELNALTSEVADRDFNQCPTLSNELLNRDAPSSNAVAAQKALLKQMVLHAGKPRVGIEGYPAEGGLFDSILLASKLYRENSGGWRFAAPTKSDPANLGPAWAAAEAHLKANLGRTVALSELYSLWSDRPFGIKEGLAPVLAVTFLLANRERLAFYRDGLFQAHFTDLDIDYLATDASSIQLRWMDLSQSSRDMLQGLAGLLGEVNSGETLVNLTPIDVARGLVAIHDKLKPWAKRTAHVSSNAGRIRNLFRFANDPNKFVFDDIPALIGEATAPIPEVIEHVREGLLELMGAYPGMLKRLMEMMLTELQVPNASKRALSELRERASNIRELSGDFRLNSFVGRLSQFEGADNDMEDIASFAVNKPARDWVDADLDRAAIELASLAQAFNRTEAFARVKGRPDLRQAMAVVVGLNGQPTSLVTEFDITKADREAVDRLIDRVAAALGEADDGRRNVILAALAELSARYMQPAVQKTGKARKVAHDA